MALIEMQADLKETNRLLERLVRVLERGLQAQFGLSYGHCAEKAEDANPAERESIGYADDLATLKEEIRESMGLLKEEEDE